MLLSFLFAISLMAEAAQAMENQTSACGMSGDILLNGTNLIKAPEFSFITPGLNWTYPYSYYPIYSEGQKISGHFMGPDQLAGANIKLCVSAFNLSRFINASAADIADEQGDMSQVELNDTGDGYFTIQGQRIGTYMLSAIDRPNSTVLSMMPLIITAQEISVDSPAKVHPGEILKAAVKIPESDNLTKYYGGVMVLSEDYEGMNLNIATNGSQRNLSSTIAFGNRSMTVQGLPGISMDLLMKLSTILPQNSAVAMQVSSKTEAELNLMTDPGLERGRYILTCVVYSPGKGILGMRQIPVEVS